MRACGILLMVSGWLAVTLVQAQLAEDKSAAQVIGAVERETVPVRERERRVYVPFEDFEKVFEDGGRGVFLPYREFLELWNELTLKREDEDKPPPADAVLSGAEYTGTVEGDNAVLDARLTVESFQAGWVSLPLLGKNLPGIGEAGTGKAVLRSDASGTQLLLPDKGVYEIRLKIYAPVTRRDDRRVVGLRLPVAAVSRLNLIVPGADLDFEVKPAAAFSTREHDGRTEFACFFGEGDSLEIAWLPRVTEAVMEPLILAETKLQSAIGAGSVSTRAEIRHRILRAPVDRLRIGLPAAQEVLGVTGAGLQEWRLEPAANGRRVLVAVFEKPVRDRQTLTLDLEAPLAELPGEVRVPEIEVMGAAFAHGEATVTAEAQLDAAPRVLTAAARVQSAEGGGKGEVGVFRLLRQPYELSFEVTEARPQVEVTSQTRLELQRDSARFTAAFQYQVRRVGLFEAQVALPPGWTVSEVTGTVESWQIEGGEAAPMLLARFSKQMSEGIAFTVKARQPRGGAEEEVMLPVFKPVSVARHEGVLGVVLPDSLEANTKAIGGFQQEDVKALRAGQHAEFWREGAEAGLAFRYLDDAAPGVLALKSRSPQVSVEVLTLLDAREQSTRHTWTLVFDVSYAATDRFVLAVPKAVADTLRLVDPQIKEINRDYQPAQPFDLPDVESFTLWEVVLRNEMLGGFQLSASHEQAAAIEAGGATVNLLPLHVPGAFQETGQVAVSKADSLEIREARAETLEEIDSRELRPEAGFTGVFLAYKYRSLPVKLGVDLVKNSYFAVPQAVVTHADLTTAVASDGAQTTEAVYWVKNNGLQFLEVSLPVGARLVSDAQVGAEAQQPMRREGSEALLIRLQSGSGSGALPVRLVFEVASPKPGTKWGVTGSFSVLAPQLPAVGVLETRHRLFLPEEWHYTAIDSPLTRANLTRGWTRARWWLDFLIPAFGPQPASLGQARWSDPPQIEVAQRSLFGFQVPEQGHLETLRRLGPPAEVRVAFRSAKRTFGYEAAAFLIALLAGLLIGGRSPARRILTVAAMGFGGLLATGWVGPAEVPVARSVMLAAALLAGLWLLAGVWGLLRALLARRKKTRPPVTVTQPPPASLASIAGAGAAAKRAVASDKPATVSAPDPERSRPTPGDVQVDDIEEPSVPPLPAADERDERSKQGD